MESYIWHASRALSSEAGSFSCGESFVDRLKHTVARLRRHIAIYLIDEVVTLRAIMLAASQAESVEAKMEIVWTNIAAVRFFDSLPSVLVRSIVIGILKPRSIDQIGLDDVVNVRNAPYICLSINWKSPRG